MNWTERLRHGYLTGTLGEVIEARGEFIRERLEGHVGVPANDGEGAPEKPDPEQVLQDPGATGPDSSAGLTGLAEGGQASSTEVL